MIVTSCNSQQDCDLSIAYNVQVPLCSTSPQRTAGPCRDPEALCVADPDFAFNFSKSDDNSVSSAVHLCVDETDLRIIPGFNDHLDSSFNT
jgi:integrin alpha FG-GAP repeat containing protein 1